MKNLTAKELAERWSMSTNTLANMRVAKKGPKWIQPGGPRCHVLYPISEVEKWEQKKK
jgi:hypothetical protein